MFNTPKSLGFDRGCDLLSAGSLERERASKEGRVAPRDSGCERASEQRLGTMMATGQQMKGCEPRIISLASAHLSPDGRIMDVFHEYVKTDLSADPMHGITALSLAA